MRERGISFKEALNEAARSGLLSGKQRAAPEVRAEIVSAGRRTGVPLGQALALADAMEDEELGRKLSLGQ